MSILPVGKKNSFCFMQISCKVNTSFNFQKKSRSFVLLMVKLQQKGPLSINDEKHLFSPTLWLFKLPNT